MDKDSDGKPIFKNSEGGKRQESAYNALEQIFKKEGMSIREFKNKSYKYCCVNE